MSWTRPALIILLAGLLVRVAWLFTPAGYPDADEAVFGLMALHIQQGREYPLFCWGAHYAGALVSYLAAVSYGVFGMGAVALKSATLPFAAGYLAVTYGLARLMLDERSALVALLIAAVPPTAALTMSVKATGGYPETLCLGGLVLLLAFRFSTKVRSVTETRRQLFLLGCVGGFGFYILPLIVPYLVVALWFLYRHHRASLLHGRIGWLAAGGLLGVSPLLLYNVMHPGATILRLGSRVLQVSKAEVLDPEAGPMAAAGWIGQYVAGLPVHLAALAMNAGPLLGFEFPGGALVAWVVIGGSLVALARRRPSIGWPVDDLRLGRWCATFAVCALVFAWLAGLNRPRHLVILFTVLPLGLAMLHRHVAASRPALAQGALAAALTGVLWMLAADASRSPVKPVEPLVQVLHQAGARSLYADYEISYLVMFVSKESVLASPTAWTQAPGLLADRTPEITREVDRLPDPAYAFFHGSDAASWFAEGLARRGITVVRRTVGDFELFTDLSVPVRSHDLPVSRTW